MKTFFDSSSLAKRYINEAGSQEVDDLCQRTDELGVAIILAPEIISALTRRLREEVLTQEDYRIAKTQLLADIGDAVVINLAPAVFASAINLLEQNTLRAMDSLHVACALAWRADLFVSSDQRQMLAAANAGLKTHRV